MSDQFKHFYYTIPNRSTLKRLFHWHALNVFCFDAMQASNHFPQFFDNLRSAIMES